MMKKDTTEKINRLTRITDVDYPQSKEDIWDLMEDKLTKSAHEDEKIRRLSFQKWAIAASIAILLGIGSFMKFYQVEYSTLAGQQYTAQLPDGSTVELNGQSSLQYHPFWWKMDRSLKFEGEAYFEVEKGKRFSVESKNGVTTVLGTSFNIYARDTNYEVNCLTGKVKVEVPDGQQQIIYPNQQVKLENNQLQVSDVNADHSTDWRNQNFIFTSATLKRVFREIEIAYNVSIKIQGDETLVYSGSFEKLDNIEEVLTIVCIPLNLNFEKQSPGNYLIKSNE